jgi:hypothetical protein
MTSIFRRPCPPVTGSFGRQGHSLVRRRFQAILVMGVLCTLAVLFLWTGGTATTAGSNSGSGIAVLQQQTIILQNGVSPEGYAGTSDAYMESIFPNRLWGVEDPDVLRLKSGRYHALLRFDLSPLPAGAQVLSALLSLYSYNSDSSVPMIVEVYQVLRPWVDTEVTWNEARSGEAWEGPGCSVAGIDRDAAPCSVETLTSGERWYDFDVTSVVAPWANGAAQNHGFVLAPSPSANSHRFRSADAGWDRYRFLRPKLVITYQIAAETPTQTSTSTSEATQTATSLITATPSSTSSATAMPSSTPSATATSVSVRTPMPDSLYDYPEQRVGFVAFGLSRVDAGLLHAGFIKLEDRVPRSSDLELGADFCTVLRVGREYYETPDSDTYWTWLADMVTSTPGHLWFVGNEPENPCRGNRFSGEYAQIYHDLYTFIKDIDPTAQVGIGGVVLPSAIRRRWLEKVLDAYQRTYSEPMPIDVWNIHNLLLGECPGECGQAACPGAYVPREQWPSFGERFTQADQANVSDFVRLLLEFRQWMKSNPYQDFQNTPLIVTEMGVFAGIIEQGWPDDFSHDKIIQFMSDTFDFMMNAKDPEIGCPADDYRLVQRWAWYSLIDIDFNGFLFENGTISDYGLNFANYTARYLPVAPTYIFCQRGWTGYYEDCDTWIAPQEARPLANFLSISSDGTRKALLKFDLSVLPTDVQVISATLSLRTANHLNIGDMLVHCYGVARPWDISEATWTNANAATLWEAAGCSGVGDRDQTPADSVLVTDDNTTYAWDVTEMARVWVADPSANHGVVLEGEAVEEGYWTFRSSDQAEDAAHTYHRLRPKLELLVRLLEPTPTPTSTPTITELPTPTTSALPSATPTATPTEVITHRVFLPVINSEQRRASSVVLPQGVVMGWLDRLIDTIIHKEN